MAGLNGIFKKGSGSYGQRLFISLINILSSFSRVNWGYPQEITSEVQRSLSQFLTLSHRWFRSINISNSSVPIIAVTGVLIFIPAQVFRAQTKIRVLTKARPCLFLQVIHLKRLTIFVSSILEILKITTFPFISSRGAFCDDINKELTEFFKAVEVWYSDRVLSFFAIFTSPRAITRVRNGFSLNDKQENLPGQSEGKLRTLSSIGHRYLTAFCVSVYKVAEAQIIYNERLKILQQLSEFLFIKLIWEMYCISCVIRSDDWSTDGRLGSSFLMCLIRSNPAVSCKIPFLGNLMSDMTHSKLSLYLL